jgi:hypothetical protein
MWINKIKNLKKIFGGEFSPLFLLYPRNIVDKINDKHYI